MKNFRLKTAFAASLLIFSAAITSCKDDDDTTIKPTTNDITLTTPADGAVVNAGQTVTITGNITGEKELHGYNVIIRQKADSKVLFTKENHAHSTSIAINESWAVDTVAKYKELEMEIIATLDHSGNTLTKKTVLHALPAGEHNHATITITAPTEGGMVSAGQVLNVTGKVEGISSLHGYNMVIRSKADNQIVHTFPENHDHFKTINVSGTWTVPAVTGHTEYELEIVAKLDHDGTTITKKVYFYAMP
ncbi:DUF4625 domain-containing protein [Adhaeribacter soli]|uniref:DUF4625 domain-containing protein n=1 Tax=Adhaeribacter soli TaxID=2607655 RepID=A0A5N1J555_9BACT|nr:DUF4625 domain-containing protein [Adhaeribacter soli]KAA9345834.1 DUF4625 domain-containing protein [Adhaeribacter soli]